jgi:2-polyprenyl-3-methyl-5-hydroxy-6-metoxy-1,4-benzoquinol methylase
LDVFLASASSYSRFFPVNSSPEAVIERTFRDPAGSVELSPEGVLRTVVQEHAAETLEFLATPLAAKLVADGHLIPTTILLSDDAGLQLSHPRIPFISYPSEWTPSLWAAAAELTLNLCTQLVEQGWMLKDATPLNVLFAGTRPVFVDLLSIRRIEPKPIWYAYGQFVRTFLLPLLAHAQLGWRLQTAQTWRDGIEPEELYAALSWSHRLRYPARSFITLPVVLGRMMKSLPANAGTQGPTDQDFIRRTLLKTLSSLRAAVVRAAPVERSSTWSNYTETAGHYSGGDHAEKRQFVTESLAACTPTHVLDVGSNTGNYSRIAAATGAHVVAIDSDQRALELLYAQSRQASQNILPLCVDLSYPTPATGWNNRESFSFLARCEGHFDTVMMLAVIHHILLSSQVPLELIAPLCARITSCNLILEWVPPTDPKFIEVLRGREAIYTHITEAAFRKAFAPFFRVEREMTLSNQRILFHMVRT